MNRPMLSRANQARGSVGPSAMCTGPIRPDELFMCATRILKYTPNKVVLTAMTTPRETEEMGCKGQLSLLEGISRHINHSGPVVMSLQTMRHPREAETYLREAARPCVPPGP